MGKSSANGLSSQSSSFSSPTKAHCPDDRAAAVRPPGYVDLEIGAELLTKSLDPQVLKLGRAFLEQFAGAWKYREKPKHKGRAVAPKAVDVDDRADGSCAGTIPIRWLPGPSRGDFYVSHSDVLAARANFTWFVRDLLPSRKRKRKGRPKGSTMEGDDALIAEAIEMNTCGIVKGALPAAEILAHRAKGASREANVDRLRHKISDALKELEEK